MVGASVLLVPVEHVKSRQLYVLASQHSVSLAGPVMLAVCESGLATKLLLQVKPVQV